MARLKACPYCGKIHSGECSQKPKKKYKRNDDNKVRKFRKSAEWTHVRQQVLERDKYCCQICLQRGIINASKSHHVHHIEPLQYSWEDRTNVNNLITLCEHHHNCCHQGVFNKIDLLKLVNTKYEK